MSFSNAYFSPQQADGGTMAAEAEETGGGAAANADTMADAAATISPILPEESAPGPSAGAGGEPTVGADDAANATVEQTMPLPSSAGGGQTTPSTSTSTTAAAPAAMPTSAAKKKKKGTAATVKAPKRAAPKRPKSAKKGAAAPGPKAGGGKKPTVKKETGDHGSAGAGSSESEGGSDDDSESDHGPYCLCRGPDDHRWMISCEACEDWFHGECVNVTKDVGETLIQAYICPNCTVDNPADGRARLVTRYKKTCALEGCRQPARILDPKAPKAAAAAQQRKGGSATPHSVFCSQEHCNVWWEQLVGTLPKDEGVDGRGLTQSEFMSLLASSGNRKPTGDGAPGGGWFVGQKPFDVSADFWDTHDPKDVLTSEEADLLALSLAERRGLAEEVVMCRKMLQLMEIAAAQRREAITSGRLESDGCGYDTALDTIGVQAQFAAFLRSPAGEAAFKTGKLESGPYVPPPVEEADGGEEAAAAAAANALLASSSISYLGPWEHPSKVEKTYMCERRRCKPHTNWYAIHTRHVHFLLKELAAEAKVKLDMETRVRKNAAVRFYRRRVEPSSVTRFDSGDDEDSNDGGTDKDKLDKDERMDEDMVDQ
ncbi:hypothetical protein MAPG_02504 [Magnaporthiopsis poae ATCC 64411]|uniref:PHD-type domain-containing protein n=1 Tax=Magnaporthiopsis poae (strain ATCC 64411 / 73-15) TaxID=644358 RepID=A0A0C4DRJ4_MAGP6|nr:hypothetical protein MAPG_02504 [Magnaporthiopsis poae ATCC 64411]